MILHPIFLSAFGKKAVASFSVSICGFFAFVADAIPIDERYKPLFDLGLAGVVIIGMASAIVFLAKSYIALQREMREMVSKHAEAIQQITAAHATESLEREKRLTAALEEFTGK